MATQHCQPNQSGTDERPGSPDVHLMFARAIERVESARDQWVSVDQLLVLILHWTALDVDRMGFRQEALRFIEVARKHVPQDALPYYDFVMTLQPDHQPRNTANETQETKQID